MIHVQGCYACAKSRDLQPLVGPTFKRPAQDPLAVLNLDNRLYTLTTPSSRYRILSYNLETWTNHALY